MEKINTTKPKINPAIKEIVKLFLYEGSLMMLLKIKPIKLVEQTKNENNKVSLMLLWKFISFSINISE
jgi:hypothetical protein